MPLIVSSLRKADWPKIDRDLWKKAQQPAGLFDDGGLAADWRPATLNCTERSNATWLAWLSMTGDLEPLEAPVDRATVERLRTFIEAYGDGRSDYTVASVVHHLAEFLRVVQPEIDTSHISRLGYRLMARAKPARPKAPRLVPVAELTSLGITLMNEGQALLDNNKVSGAQVYRDGLMIALWAQRPLRRRNVAALQLDGSLIADGNRFRIVIPSSETKNHRAIDVSLPNWLSPWLHRYLATVRAVLLRRSSGEDGKWLWIGRRGRRMSETEISHRIARVTQTRLGRRLSPHLFRDCAATDIALHDPAHVGITKSVLGQAKLASARFYNQAGSFEASRRHQAAIASIRS